MIFACDRCGRRYSVPDERVQGRSFRVTCKACGNVIVVKPGGVGRTAAPAAPAPPREAATITGPTIQVSGMGAQVRKHDSSRSLTAAEMAWMSDHDARTEPPPVEPEAGVAADVKVEVGEAAPAAASTAAAVEAAGEAASVARSERGGPGIARVAVAAALLGVAAAAVIAFFFWPGRHPTPPPPPPPVAAAPAPAPVPPTPPVPPPAAQPTDQDLAALVAKPPAEPPPAAPAPRAGPGAHFEPGTVQIGKARPEGARRLTRKDRKLLDLLSRKRDVGAPPEPVEKLDLDSSRSLDQGAVERVIEESQGAFSGCVTRAAKVAGAPDARRATLLLTVARSGQVASAWVAEEDVSRTGLGRCLVGAARRLVFPAFEGGPVDVSVPLTLEAR